MLLCQMSTGGNSWASWWWPPPPSWPPSWAATRVRMGMLTTCVSEFRANQGSPRLESLCCYVQCLQGETVGQAGGGHRLPPGHQAGLLQD